MYQTYMLLSDAAKVLDVKPYRIHYAITNGLVDDVARLGNRRIFSADDVRSLARHFGVAQNAEQVAERSVEQRQ